MHFCVYSPAAQPFRNKVIGCNDEHTQTNSDIPPDLQAHFKYTLQAVF